jgi:hypothetical protein
MCGRHGAIGPAGDAMIGADDVPDTTSPSESEHGERDTERGPHAVAADLSATAGVAPSSNPVGGGLEREVATVVAVLLGLILVRHCAGKPGPTSSSVAPAAQEQRLVP